ncbi:transposase [Methylobacterium sp.]|uniref:transposase n=1 Tax=Methylobacterium sp. TaxID=409 RepID=UPI00257CAA00|nr:transposase [Methylobacterium sp.]
MLEQIEAALGERDAAGPAPADADAEKVARLGGIGNESATVAVREALYRPFANRKQMAAYAGLKPNPYASGDRQRDKGIFLRLPVA